MGQPIITPPAADCIAVRAIRKTAPSSKNPRCQTLSSAGLAVLIIGLLLPQIDFSIVNVALAAIAHSLHANETGLELLVAVYGVAFAVCLAMGGRLGDRYGRVKIFNLGVMLFGIASLLCGIAPSMHLLLLARALQGAGAALLVPQILATIHVCLKGQRHARAIGLYASVGGVSFILGQVLGGWLVSSNIAGMGWRSVFLINLPLCLLVLLFSRKTIPETRSEHAATVDLPGTLLLACLILAILLPVALGPSLHWSWPCFAGLCAALVLLWGLWRVELSQESRGLSPLLPPSLIRIPSIRFGLILAILFYSCWSGFMFVVALSLQAGASFSPIQAGNAFIALGLAYSVGAYFSSRLLGRFGTTLSLIIGCVIQMCGLLALIFTFNRVWPHPGILSIAPATMVMAFGQSIIVNCFYRISLSDVPTEHAGAGSAALSTVQQAALGIGAALLGAIFAQALSHSHSYLQATIAGLGGEFILMLIVLAASIAYHRYRRRQHQV